MAVSEQIIQVLDKLCEKVGLVIDWSATNVLPQVQILCEKYIHWEISTSIVWIVIGALLMLSAIFVWVWEIVNDWATDGLTFLFILPFGGAGVVIILTQIFDIVRCNVFPEMQIINYINFLIK